MKNIISFILICSINYIGAEKSQRLKGDVGIPFFNLTTPAFFSEDADQVKLDVYIKISHDAIQFLKYGNGFKAKYELSISILDSTDAQIEEDIYKGSAFAKKYSETTSKRLNIVEIRTFYLDPGKYQINVKLMDLDTRKTGRSSYDIDLTRFKKELVISDLMMIDPSNNKIEDFQYGYPIIPSILADGDSIIYLYCELRVPEGPYKLTTKMISFKKKVLAEESIEGESRGEIIQQIINQKPVDISTKNFKIEVKLEQGNRTSKAEILVKVRWKGLTSHVSDINEAINQLRYIAPTNDIKAMKKAVRAKKKEQIFRDFWKKRDPTPNTPKNELMDEYYRRVNFANERYGSFRKGWETARGMIFILFGPPDDIETNLFSPDGKAYQRWSYYLINRSFTFVDRNGFGDYELIEPYYPTIGTGNN